MARSILLLSLVAAVPAVRGGLYDDIYRGLQILATPSGSPLFSTGDGTRFNGSRSGRVRIVPNSVGEGYSLELNRTFGVDTQGRPETLDLGLYELQLSGALSATLGYTSRTFLIGNADVALNNLAYTLRAKSGAQDIVQTGTLNAVGNMEVNQLGFYTLNLDVQNASSTLTEDGVLVTGDHGTNFDIGPISVKGNIYADLFVGLLQTLGVDTSALNPLVAKSPVDQITDALRQQLEKVAPLASARYTSDGQLPPAPINVSLAPQPVVLSGEGSRSVLMPEPGTLVLITLAGASLWAWRRR